MSGNEPIIFSSKSSPLSGFFLVNEAIFYMCTHSSWCLFVLHTVTSPVDGTFYFSLLPDCLSHHHDLLTYWHSGIMRVFLCWYFSVTFCPPSIYSPQRRQHVLIRNKIRSCYLLKLFGGIHYRTQMKISDSVPWLHTI